MYSQFPYRCKFDWGIAGTMRAATRGDLIVLVDTLSFSTTTAYAISRGAIIYPCGKNDNPVELARLSGGEVAGKRSEGSDLHRYSLSPITFNRVTRGEKVVLPALNGGSCSRVGQAAPILMVGAFVNKTAVTARINREMADTSLNITAVACGERDENPAPNGELRMAIEDYLAAGAIISELNLTKSPEAELCEAAFRHSEARIETLVWDCVSGRELRMRGFADDVKFALRMDSIQAVPILQDGAFRESMG
jgi:2-phosphosulfolactate phosphatase